MTVVELVGRERRRLRAALLGMGGASALAAGAALVAAGAWLLGDARWLTLPRGTPWLVWAAVLGALAAVAWWTTRRVRRDSAPHTVAAAIEHERALRAGAVRGALEIERAEGGPGALGGLAARTVAARLAPHAREPLAPLLQRRARRAALAAGGAALAAVALLAVAAASADDGMAALVHPVDAWRGALLAPIRIVGAPASLVRGEPLRVMVSAPGRRAVRVTYRETGRAWTEQRVTLGESGDARVNVGTVDAELALVASDGRMTSDTVRVRVADRAFLGDLVIRAEYPAYLGRGAETLAPGEPARVPQGTVLALRGRASTALETVALAGAGGSVALPVQGHTFTGRFAPERSGRWTWAARGTAGALADVPPPLDVQLVADSAPRVELQSPAGDSTVDGLAAVRVAVSATDDHGLAEVALSTWVERGDGRREPAIAARLIGAVPAWAGEGVVDLAGRKLGPGDKVHVQAVAVDASPWRQSASSREIVLRVPSASDLRAQARAAADSAVARATAAAATQRDLQQRTGDAARSRESARTAESKAGDGSSSEGGSAQSNMSYAAAERAKGLAREQRQLGDKVQQLREQAQALERQLKQAGALDSSLSRQLADVQRLLRDALTPEMEAQLRGLEQNASKLSSTEARQSLEQLAAQQRALRQQLEKSVDMLKRAALEGAMQTMRDEAKELAEAQRKEAERLQRGDAAPSSQTRELADRSRALERDVDQLTKRLGREQATAGAEQAKEAAKHADASADAMSRAAQRAGEPKPGQQQAGEQRGAEQRAGEQSAGQQSAGEQSAGQQPNGAPRAGQQSAGQQSAGQQQGGAQRAGNEASRAAQEMSQTAERLGDARQRQIDQWKGELAQEIDRAVQETMQMAREQGAVERQAREGADQSSLRAQQSAVQQGVERTAQRLDQASKTSSLLSQRAQRAMGEARQQVQQATQALQKQGTPGPTGSPGSTGSSGSSAGSREASTEAANAMKDATEALARAASALVRDRERVNGAQSATGFSEMIQQMRQLAQQQGQINSQAQGLPLPMPGAAGQGAREAMRKLAQQQRGVAEKLDDVSDADPSGRTDAMAREARQLAQALERNAADPSTTQRQQQLYRRLLDAGRTLEQDERDETGKREARSGAGIAGAAPADGPQSGKTATRFAVPTWEELRGLAPEERRQVIEYFRRLNARQGEP